MSLDRHESISFDDDCVLPAVLTHSTLRTMPAGPTQGGGDQRGIQAAAMVTVTTAATHQQTADITGTQTQHTLRGDWREKSLDLVKMLMFPPEQLMMTSRGS